jgi:hypothetical protein
MHTSDRLRHTSAWIFLVLLVLGATIVAFLGTQAKPAYALPTRPEDRPTAKVPVKTTGGGIELSVSGAVGTIYAVVQWQDGLGGWHDVEGWRGQVEESHVLWFVSERDFGTGPFRWMVYDDQGPLATSESFNLPENKGVVERIAVQIPPDNAS